MKIRTYRFTLLLAIAWIAGTAQAFSQAENVSKQVPFRLPEIVFEPSFYLWLVLGMIVVAVLLTLSKAISVLTLALEDKTAKHAKETVIEQAKEEKPSLWGSWMQSLTRAVPIERERDVMLDHDYDGIRELDNQLPPWWKWGFVFTILFAFFYLFSYHLSGTGKLQLAEYDEQIKEAARQREELMARSAAFVTVDNVVVIKDASGLAEGKGIFEKNCVACHRSDGGGNVGPNLTDEYWIHGGGIKNVFATVTNGVPAKGMISWKSQLSPKQIQEVASYVLTLEGTHPTDAKAPQGDLWVANPAPVDSTAAAPLDTILKKS